MSLIASKEIVSQEVAFSDLITSQHAAIYSYGVIAANLTDPEPALDRLATHRRKRDELIVLAQQAGLAIAPAAAYQLPNPVSDGVTAIACATALEEGLCAHWSAAIPFLFSEAKLSQIAFVQDCAKRAFEWSGIAKAFYE